MNIKEFLNLKTSDKLYYDGEYCVVEIDNNKINFKYDYQKSETINIYFEFGNGYSFEWLCFCDGECVWKESLSRTELETMIQKWQIVQISNQEILNLSVSTFPVDSHYRQLNEEIGEFNVALSHYFRNRCGIESVIEEIADVKQMLDTWMLILKISKEDYEKIENEKYQKLLSQINEFEKKSETDFRKLIEEQKLKGEI